MMMKTSLALLALWFVLLAVFHVRTDLVHIVLLMAAFFYVLHRRDAARP